MMIWHYTTGEKAAAIMAGGVLRPAAANVPAHEIPVLWLSARQDFEPTARKGIVTPSGTRTASIMEMRALAGGLFRFGIAAELALPWRETCEAANIHRDQARALASAGRECGANPSDWYAIVGELPLTRVAAIEVMNDTGDWIPAVSVGPVYKEPIFAFRSPPQ